MTCNNFKCKECGENEERHNETSEYCADCSIYCDCCNEVKHYSVEFYFCDCGIVSCNKCKCKCIEKMEKIMSIDEPNYHKCKVCNYECQNNNKMIPHKKGQKHKKRIIELIE